MAKSPRTAAQGPIEVMIENEDGNEVASGQLIALTVTKALNRIPCARIVLEDGDVSDQNYPLSDGDDFKHGAEITIKAGYDGKTDDIFKGIVVRHRLRIGAAQGARLVVECRDKAYKMTLDRKNASYVDKLDSAVMEDLIKSHPGLSADVTATDVSYGEMIQYYCSDWDYMLSRAEMNGQVVIVDDAKVSINVPKTDGESVLEVKYGEDIIDFDADIDGRTQLKSVESVAWDPANQKMESDSAEIESLTDQGDLDGVTLATAVGTDKYRLQTPATLEKASLTGWAKARQLKASLARIQGKVTFTGCADAILGALIDLEGVGNRFDGKVYLSRVEHNIRAGEWLTVAEFGLPPNWFIESHDVVAPPASGWAPSISGLHVGVVKKLDEDPAEQFRIQVTVPVLGDEAEAVWARLSQFYASNQFGAYFVPEIGDEVVLGFMNDDPSHPVVLGSVYSSKLPPPYTDLTADNTIKALVTKSKMKLEFDDDKKIITIWTPEGNQLILSEEDKTITLEDQNSNKMTMSSGGIDLESPKDININAKGNVSIDAVGKINITAKQDVAVKGLNVSNTADVGFTAKGNASAELSASGQTTVKGAMVMIN